MKFFSNIFGSSQPAPQQHALTTISRTQVIDGFSIPGIIKNVQYHLTDLQVYKDGLVYCWDMVDFQLFRKKLDSNWVVPFIPDHQTISIFGLGNWEIDKGEWLFNKDSFETYIHSLVKQLNPRMENLYNCHGRTTDKIGHVNVAIFPMPNPQTYYFSKEDPIFSQRTQGKSFYIFFRDDDSKLYLATISIFKNGHAEITGLPDKKSFELNNIQKLIDEKRLLTHIPHEERVYISGLGSFVTVSSDYVVSIQEKYRQILDEYHIMNGSEGSIARCARLLEEYKKNPNAAAKDELKRAYEAIPEHERSFVGDMDTRDTEVRAIIYDEE
jgi:hypothetical protein